MKRVVIGMAFLLGGSSPLFGGDVSEAAAVVRGNSRFALELYSKLREKDGNLLFSPSSISAALAMTSAGASGRTLDQMAVTLHLPEQERLHPALGRLLKGLNEPSRKGYQLSTANALWGQAGFPFQKEFLTLTADHYAGGFQTVDFVKDTEGSRGTINAWVERHTGDRVQGLLKAGVLTTDTRLVLTNAVYFKGSWATPFKTERTEQGAFHLSGKATVNVPLMSQTHSFNHLRTADLSVLELPYAGDDLSLLVLLPRKADGLPALERALTADNLASWAKRLRPERLRVVLPRFQMAAELDLKETLGAMGMPLPFTNAADFSRMIDARQQPYLAAVVHKAVLDVNEKGTEAAGSTAAVIEVRSLPQEFRADHPFAFVLRDNRSGTILFLGRLTNPK